MKTASKEKIKIIYNLLDKLSIEEKAVLAKQLIEDVELDEGNEFYTPELDDKIDNIKLV